MLVFFFRSSASNLRVFVSFQEFEKNICFFLASILSKYFVILVLVPFVYLICLCFFSSLLALNVCFSPNIFLRGFTVAGPYVGRDLDYWGVNKWKDEIDR